MTVTLASNGTIELTGTCPVEDAETLLQHLLAAPGTPVDWTACEAAHTAVIQVLLAARLKPAGRPAGRFLRERISPLIDGVS